MPADLAKYAAATLPCQRLTLRDGSEGEADNSPEGGNARRSVLCWLIFTETRPGAQNPAGISDPRLAYPTPFLTRRPNLRSF